MNTTHHMNTTHRKVISMSVNHARSLLGRLSDPFSEHPLNIGDVYRREIIGPTILTPEKMVEKALKDPLFQKFFQAFLIVITTQPANLVKIGVQSGGTILDTVMKYTSNGGFYKGAGTSIGLNTVARTAQLTLYSECKEALKEAGCENKLLETTLPVLVATIGETFIQHIAEKYLSGLAGELSPTDALKSAFKKLGLKGIQHTLSRNLMAATGFFVLPEIIQKHVINKLFDENSEKVGFLAMATAFVTTFVAGTPFDTAKQLHMNHAATVQTATQKLATQVARFTAASLNTRYPRSVQTRFERAATTTTNRLSTLQTKPWPSTRNLLQQQGFRTISSQVTRLMKGAGLRAVVGGTIAVTLFGVNSLFSKA